MAGTIIADVIQSDQSYPSSINIASPVIISNTFAFPAGTVSAPAFFPTGDTNTGIFFPAADTMAFAEGGVEAMRVNSSGYVGIGQTSPSNWLDISANTSASVGHISLNTTSASQAIRQFFRESGTAVAQVAWSVDSNALEIIAQKASSQTVFYTAGTERMRIDGSGRVTMPYQPAFQVENISGALATNNVVPWSSVVTNRGSHYNNSTHRFTAPVAGFYQFNLIAFTVRTTSTGDTYWDIRINGSLKSRLYQAKSGSADVHQQSMGSVACSLAVNDYVEVVYVAAAGNANMEAGPNHNQFSGFLVG